MIITAHGGALKTGRNTKKFLEKMQELDVDAIEVDVIKFGKTLFLAHTIFDLLKCKKLKLADAFEYVKKNNWLVNCDVKQVGLVKDVLSLAREMGVTDNIMFTGSVSAKDIAYLDGGKVYLNDTFFPFAITDKTVKTVINNIKKYSNTRVAGINISYKIFNEKLAFACEKEGLAVSVYTVDNIELLKKISNYKAVVNITTNIPNKGLEILGNEANNESIRYIDDRAYFS